MTLRCSFNNHPQIFDAIEEMPGSAVEKDNTGQLVIYTGLKHNANGDLVQIDDQPFGHRMYENTRTTYAANQPIDPEPGELRNLQAYSGLCRTQMSVDIMFTPGHPAAKRLLEAYEELRTAVEESHVNVVSCGCCSNGCVCWNHRDEPKGRHEHKCDLHRS